MRSLLLCYAVVRAVLRARSNPFIGVLTPHLATAPDRPDTLILNTLPFAEDMRGYFFKSFSKDQSKPEVTHPAASCRSLKECFLCCSQPLRDIVGALVYCCQGGGPGLQIWQAACCTSFMTPRLQPKTLNPQIPNLNPKPLHPASGAAAHPLCRSSACRSTAGG